jgi:glutathione-regulated potassium-efflux system ancillary protein KefG
MTSQRRILVLFAHPRLRSSRVNRVMAHAVRDVAGITLHDLYEAYPAQDIDVRLEQELLVAHDVIVFQHPFYWYSTPSILKEWQDLVLEHGWAYGREGRALHGKIIFNAITTGGGEDAYGRDGPNHFTIRELLAPIEQTARLCGMEYLPPFVVHGTHRLDARSIVDHAADYRRLLEALRDHRIDIERASSRVRLNADLDSIARS